MSDAFKAGDLVECIDDGLYDGPPLPRLVLGALYTVVDTGIGVEDDPWVDVAECLRVPLSKWGWAAAQFRLIHEPDTEFIEALKALPADLVREEA